MSRHGAPFDELNHRDGLFSELTNGERRPEHGNVVGENDVDTGAIKKHPVNDGFVVRNWTADTLGHGAQITREEFPLTEPNIGSDHAKHLVIHVDMFEPHRVNIFQHLVGK